MMPSGLARQQQKNLDRSAKLQSEVNDKLKQLADLDEKLKMRQDRDDEISRHESKFLESTTAREDTLRKLSEATEGAQNRLGAILALIQAKTAEENLTEASIQERLVQLDRLHAVQSRQRQSIAHLDQQTQDKIAALVDVCMRLPAMEVDLSNRQSDLGEISAKFEEFLSGAKTSWDYLEDQKAGLIKFNYTLRLYARRLKKYADELGVQLPNNLLDDQD